MFAHQPVHMHLNEAAINARMIFDFPREGKTKFVNLITQTPFPNHRLSAYTEYCVINYLMSQSLWNFIKMENDVLEYNKH